MYEYARPESLGEAITLLRDVPGSRPLCGGTDLLVGIRKRTVTTRLVVDLKRAADLPGGIERRDGVLRIGATTVMTDLIADPDVNAHFPALVEGARVVGSIQIRNRATLAGNVCNASPAADTVPALLVHGAVLEVDGPSGRRRLPVRDVFIGPGRTVLQPAEVVAAIELPLPSDPLGASFARMTRRRGVDLATVNLACAVDARGTTTFAFGAVGPRPILAVDEGGRLANEPDPQRVDAILRELTREATPISNVRASREYRLDMLMVLSRRALATARARLEEAVDGR